MIYRGTDIADSQLAGNLSAVWQAAGSPQFEIEKFPLPELTNENRFALDDFLRSDHRNFWDAGFPAIFLTDSGKYYSIVKRYNSQISFEKKHCLCSDKTFFAI